MIETQEEYYRNQNSNTLPTGSSVREGSKLYHKSEMRMYIGKRLLLIEQGLGLEKSMIKIWS